MGSSPIARSRPPETGVFISVGLPLRGISLTLNETHRRSGPSVCGFLISIGLPLRGISLTLNESIARSIPPVTVFIISIGLPLRGISLTLNEFHRPLNTSGNGFFILFAARQMSR